MNAPHELAALLRHDGHLRALARALVRDPNAADDLAQDAWRAALERRVEAHSWPAWLATVVRRLATKQRRTETRRAQREQAVARPEAGPSPAEILAREEARRRVVEALVALHEPVRTTLVLRFLEDLPPRAVARRMQVPVETVRTRTRRGLDELRGALDGAYGARERWLPALLPLARPSRSPLAPPLASSLPIQLTLSAAALALLAWLLWPREPGQVSATAPAVPNQESGPAMALARASEPLQAAAPAREALVPLPSAPAPLTNAPTGALRVHVTWSSRPHGPAEDAAGFAVRVAPDELENPDLLALEAVTDSEGVALFEGLPAGRARVNVDRDFGPPPLVEIAPGTTAETTVALEHGFDVAGLVTDEQDRPVAGAEIWFGKMPDLAHGFHIATSAADGTFRVHGVTHANLGARAAGFRPSAISYLYAADGAVIEAHLVLRSGSGEVLGTVTCSGGEPVAGAVVRVGPSGPENHTLDETLEDDWGTVVRTDEGGRLRVDGITSGTTPLAVRAAGFALWRGEVEVPAGGSARFAATLEPEAALAGHVRDALGNPARGLTVRVGEDAGPLRASVRTSDDGSYRVGALEAGRTLAAWVEGGPLGRARTEITTAAGRTELWEAVLDPLGEIRGRVVDERGAPLAGWSVRLEEPEQTDEPTEDQRRSAADGSFLFTAVCDRQHVLSVTAPGARLAQSLVQFGIRPGPDELVLRVLDRMVPSARITGSLVDEEGRVLPTAQLMAWMTSSTGSSVESCDPLTGRFDLGPYPPGEVRFIVRVTGRGLIVKEHVLAPGETWDVGEVRLALEGRLRVRLVAAELEPSDALQLACEPGFFESFEGTGAERLSPLLPPGAYTLFVGGGEYEELALPFEVQSGTETVLDVPLRRGWRTPVAVRAPATMPLVFLRLRLPGGSLLEHMLWKREGEQLVEVLHLPPGSFVVEVEAGELHASGTLVVEPVDREEPALVLELR